MATSIKLALTSCPSEQVAREIATDLVSAKLAACVNIVPGLQSVYMWQGQLCQEGEVLLLIKSTTAVLPALEQRLRQVHPYEVPEFVVLPIEHSGADYGSWVENQLAG